MDMDLDIEGHVASEALGGLQTVMVYLSSPRTAPLVPMRALALMGLVTALEGGVACAPECSGDLQAVYDQRGTRTLCVVDQATESGTDSAGSTTTEDGEFCGDGVIEGMEACDGANLGGKNCVDFGLVGGPLSCDGQCRFDKSGCGGCGNNSLNVGEVCDGTALNGEACAGRGFDGGVLACEPASACQQFDESGCFKCGDGNVDLGEDCDCGGSGATCAPVQLNNKDCTNLGAPMNGNYHGGALSCTAAPTCSFDTTQCEYCGDGMISGPEVCDAGALGGATCAAQGYQSGTPVCAPDCSVDFSDCTDSICGDGMVVGAETCDDGNTVDGDGCAADCMHEERWVFVSSVWYSGDLDEGVNNPGNVMGLKLADARCQGLADAAKLTTPPGKGTYKAWLSDGTGSPSTRFDTGFTGHYRLVLAPHPVVATGWGDLTDGELENAIDIDEKGAKVGATVWTNTGVAGEKDFYLHCQGWTSGNAADITTLGDSTATDATWTLAASGQSCGGNSRLYCFQDPA